MGDESKLSRMGRVVYLLFNVIYAKFMSKYSIVFC